MKEKIYYFQEKSNDILDLQDEFSVEEIGVYFILKAAYFKYSGDLKEDNLRQRCKFFGDIDKLEIVKKKIFEVKEGRLINSAWLSEVEDIKERSEKRRLAALEKWKKQKNKDDKPKEQKKTIKPTLQEIKDYCTSRKNNIDAKYFFDYYENGNWCDKDGKKIKNWKQKIITWESRNKTTNNKEDFSIYSKY